MLLPGCIQILWQAMVDRCNPVCPFHRCPLCIGDGNEMHLLIFAEERSHVGNIETAMERSHGSKTLPARYRKVQVIDMEVNDIESGGFLSDHLQHAEMV